MRHTGALREFVCCYNLILEVTILKFDIYENINLKLTDASWFKITKINYSYLGRKIFTKNKSGETLINPYFSVLTINETIHKGLKAWYVAAIDKDEEAYIDSDFDIGFNNVGIEYEYNLVSELKAMQGANDIYCIVAHLKGMKHPEKYDLFNKRSDKYIENNFCIVHKSNSDVLQYLIKLDSLENLTDINEFIVSYCLNPIGNILHPSKCFSDRITPMEDIIVLSEITKAFEIVITRASIFSSYNLIIYSIESQEDAIRKYLKDFGTRGQVQVQCPT